VNGRQLVEAKGWQETYPQLTWEFCREDVGFGEVQQGDSGRGIGKVSCHLRNSA